MDSQSWEEKVHNAKCPEKWTDDLLGYETGNGIKGSIRFYPGMSNIESLNSIESDFCYCNFDIYTHGIRIWIEPNHSIFDKADSRIFAMTNEQIVDIDLVPYDEYVKHKKNLGDYMTKGAAIAAVGNTGMVGVAVGAAIGAVASIGNKTSHYKGKYLRITFWNRDTKEMQYILLDHPKQKELEKLVDYWVKEKKINEETGRKPTDKPSGCFSIIILLIISTLLVSFIVG